MNQVNAIIRLNPKRLNFPLATLYPLLLHSHVVQIDNIPDDVTSVMLTVFKVNDSAYFNIPVARRPGTSTGYAYILPTCFPAIGSTKYEVHAYDSRGYATGLGAGLVAIGDFSPNAPKRNDRRNSPPGSR